MLPTPIGAQTRLAPISHRRPFGSSAAVFFCGLPTTAVGPVADEITPTFIWACAVNGSKAANNDAASSRRGERIIFGSFFGSVVIAWAA